MNSIQYAQRFQDKAVYANIFSALMQKPSLLRDYKLEETDFPEMFHAILFSAIHNLYFSGTESITALTIDGYLKDMPTQYHVYNANEGVSYIEACLEMGIPSNFEYSFQRVKKFSLLRQYIAAGMDVSDFYNFNFKTPEQEVEQNSRFNNMSVQAIANHMETKLLRIKDKFMYEKDTFGGHGAQNVDRILKQLKEEPDYGISFQSGLYNTVTRGAKRGDFVTRSGNTNSGKTRSALGDLLFQTVPIIYSKKQGRWVFTGNREKGLFITTEMKEADIVVQCLCFIAEVQEDDLRDGTMTPEEQQRINLASQIFKKSAFYIEEMFDFDGDDLEYIIERYARLFGVGYVQFDYIHTTLKMFDSLAKRGARNLQEHQVLRILTIQLKSMANRLNIFLGSSTQLNSKWKEDGTGNLDESAIEGAKAIANKLDIGSIQIALTPQDEDFYEENKVNIGALPFGLHPTHTVNIFKNRNSKWKFIRLWIHFDTGTLRTTDLFVTDYRGRRVNNIAGKHFFSDEVDLDLVLDEDLVKAYIDVIDLKKDIEESISIGIQAKELTDKEKSFMMEEQQSAMKEVGLDENGKIDPTAIDDSEYDDLPDSMLFEEDPDDGYIPSPMAFGGDRPKF